MHRVLPTIRRIVADQLPRVRDDAGDLAAASPEQLANLGYVQLEGDLYSVLEQHSSEVVPDPVTGGLKRNWLIDVPGDAIGEGAPARRFAALPSDVRDRVFRADVVRSTDPNVDALELVATNLNEQLDAIVINVGELPAGTQLLDVGGAAADVQEAQRVMALDLAPIAMACVAVADVDAATDVIVRSNILPQVWAGETAP